MQEVEDFLAHYGVKGMKWGVRRDRTTRAVDITATPGRRIKAKGGMYHPHTEEAIRARRLAQQGKKSHASSLTNAELRTVIERMNLEQQFNSLPVNQSRGRKITNAILGSTGDQHINAVGAAVTKGVAKKSARAAGPAGAAAVIGLGAAKRMAGGSKKK